jgi:hypothetical protein
MPSDDAPVMVKVQWKLEKFDGDRKEGDVPVEIIEGEDIIPLSQFLKENSNGPG